MSISNDLFRCLKGIAHSKHFLSLNSLLAQANSNECKAARVSFALLMFLFCFSFFLLFIASDAAAANVDVSVVA